MSSAAIGRLIAAGKLQPLWRGVYVVAGHRVSIKSRLMAVTLLRSRPCVSHRAAAFLWNLTDKVPPLEVTTQTSLRLEGVVTHKKALTKGDVTELDGTRVTSPHRTLIDLGDVVEDDVVEDALDRALEMRITSAAWLDKELERVGTRGKRGAATLRSLLEAGDETPPSWLERRFIRLLEASPVSGYAREHAVGPYRVDFAWADVFLGVEVHGARWHKKRLRWASDLERHNYLTAHGWTILHFTWHQIKTAPEVVISEVVSTHRRLRGWMSFSR